MFTFSKNKVNVKMMDTLQSISKILNNSICDSRKTYDAYLQKLKDGQPTRDEDPRAHFCVYFLPFNSENKKIFIIHHKKSSLWLSPGGHIDKGETLLEALNREINEELGVKNFFKNEQLPFLLTITPIDNEIQPCKAHYDIWYLASTDGLNFHIDPAEFHDVKWLTIDEAKKIITDKANVKALEIIEKL